ncbi:hypothetical protein [Endozoicomonas atrinae]|uniref:hypothetical protein n=3 Tax=Endozoicomonas atrinae TaxID=1333660 RepID=UPI003B000162
MNHLLATSLYCSGGGYHSEVTNYRLTPTTAKTIQILQPVIVKPPKTPKENCIRSTLPDLKTFENYHLKQAPSPKSTLLHEETSSERLQPDHSEWISKIRDHCAKKVFDDEEEQLITLDLSSHLHKAEQLADGYSLNLSSLITEPEMESCLLETLTTQISSPGRYLIAYYFTEGIDTKEEKDYTQTFILQTEQAGHCFALSDVPGLIDELEEFDSCQSFILRILSEDFDDEIEAVDLYQKKG